MKEPEIEIYNPKPKVQRLPSVPDTNTTRDRGISRLDTFRVINNYECQKDQPYKLKQPLLGVEDLIDYDIWKKRAWGHKFKKENLERHFWAFYMETHRTTIRIVFLTMLICPLGWMIVDYCQIKDEDENMNVFYNLLSLKLAWASISLVFLLFFHIGVTEMENISAGDQIMNENLERKKTAFQTENEDVNEVDERQISENSRSWYSQLGVTIVTYSFWSVFTICFLISCFAIASSVVGKKPSHKPYIIWFILIHIFCGLGNKASSFLCWITTIMFCIMNILVYYMKEATNDKPYKSCTYVISVAIILTVMGEFLEFSYRKMFYKRSELDMEQFKNGLMLTSVVPPRIAYQLQRGEREAVSYLYEEPNWGASVLFCQICDFEDLSNELPASALVNYLNKVFTKIDELSSRHEVYKVETVKEVYMAAAGLPKPNPDHMNQIAHFALDIKDALIDRPRNLIIDDRKDMEPSTLKIGINCGTVIAGVIGKLCPRYRLFGDTVNVAARMETNSEKGKIQITKKFKERVDEKIFETEDRGVIQIKGKDDMHTYFLTGRTAGGMQFDDTGNNLDRKNTENVRLKEYYEEGGISMLLVAEMMVQSSQKNGEL